MRSFICQWRLRRLYFLFLFAFGSGFGAVAQNPWSDISKSELAARRPGDPVPQEFRALSLDQSLLKQLLSASPMEFRQSIRQSPVTLQLPMPDGSTQSFRVVESPIMEAGLAAKYPGIRTYLGQGIDDPALTTRFDWTPQGFHAIVISPGSHIYIEPSQRGNTQHYISYEGNQLPLPFEAKSCGLRAPGLSESAGPAIELASGSQLRSYRLAVCATGEFYNLNGGTIAQALAAIVTIVNQNTAIYEREVAVRFILVADNDDLIFTDATTDPFTNTAGNPCSTPIRSESQATCDAIIGAANYDIGHVFTGTNIGGCASLGVVCGASKGWGASGVGFGNAAFDVSLSAHEIGHQFNANHTFNSAAGICPPQYAPSAAYEPGSGSTIMSYAGSCDNIQNNRDMFFHTISYDEIINYTVSGAGNGCPVIAATGNNIPTVNAGGSGFNIPINTPFTLTGSGNDADGEDALTYSWEQFDLGPAGAPNAPVGDAPIFRSFPPVTTASRTFPRLSDILNNTTALGEILPSYARNLNFRLTVRDNRANGGGVDYASMSMTVIGTAGPFRVTSPNTAVTWCPGAQTVTWDVANTDIAPISVANVRILLSTDGGNTFPTVLLASTPNDGSASVNIPCTFSSQSRIKVEAIGNVFFDISNVNFTTGDATDPTFTVPADITIYKDADCNYDATVGETGDVTDENDNCDNSLNATFEDDVDPGSCDGETIITRTWTLTDDCGNATFQVQTITIADTTSPTFTAPADITIYKDEDCEHDASVGVTGDVTDEDDNCDNTLDATFSDVTVPGTCIGEEIITRTWSLTDDCGNTTTHDQVITVLDTLPPVIDNINPDPAFLWPPNHKMIDVTINYTAVDNCSPVTNMLTVTSNEPVNGLGDGNTSPDWIVIDDHHVKLRAERSGRGDGRIYTIYITSTDDCGNVSVDSTEVTVAHNMMTIRSGDPETEMLSGLKLTIMPNPSTGQFVLSVQGIDPSGPALLQVTDLSGRIMETRSLWLDGTSTVGANYQPGVYILRLSQGRSSQSFKLVKMGQ